MNYIDVIYSDQSGPLSAQAPVLSPVQRGNHLARSGICDTCGKPAKRLRKMTNCDLDECDSCYGYRYKYGEQRPDHVVVNTAKRRANRSSNIGAAFDSMEDTAMSSTVYQGPTAPADCSCGCGRPADAGYKGLAKHCLDMQWYHSQQAVA